MPSVTRAKGLAPSRWQYPAHLDDPRAVGRCVQNEMVSIQMRNEFKGALSYALCAAEAAALLRHHDYFFLFLLSSNTSILLTFSSVAVAFYRPVASAAQVRLLGCRWYRPHVYPGRRHPPAWARNRGAAAAAILVFEVLAAYQWWIDPKQPTALLLKRTGNTQVSAIDAPCDTPAVCTRANN